MTMTPDAIPVHVYLLLDRTGSMHRIRSDVIGGFNAFVADQRSKPGECLMTVVQFDDRDPFEVLCDAAPVAEVPELNDATYIPRGSTPLLDAEGKLIVHAEERAAARAAAQEPAEAIIYATYTDGLENASHEWTYQMLTDKKAKHDGDWAFLYLGVDHDAYSQASQLGTYAVNTTTYGATGQGVTDAMDYMVTEVDHARDRAARGMTTNSNQTRSAQESRAADKPGT
jgi:hypothetical protein